MGSISIRKSIRWLPDEADEPTSTIVLTSPQRRFVDLRVFKPSPDSDSLPRGQLDPSQLEWGIGGTSSTTTRTEDGAVITRGRWDHWIDSRTPEFVFDEGDMFPLSETLTLEKGRMVNPATGREMAYEEVWEDSVPTSIPGSSGRRTCAVLKMEMEKGEKGLMVVLGRRCQIIMRISDAVTAERWDWDEQDGWTRTLWIGELAVPGKEVLERMDTLAEGDVHDVAGYSWKVVELS